MSDLQKALDEYKATHDALAEAMRDVQMANIKLLVAFQNTPVGEAVKEGYKRGLADAKENV